MLDPRARAQSLLASNRNDSHLTRSLENRLGVHGNHCLTVRGAIEQAVDVVGCAKLDTVDRDDEIADGDVDAGRRERRAKIRVPAFGVVDPRDLVAALLDDEVSTEQPARRLRNVRHVAAAHVRVTDRNLGAHVVEQIVQIGAMVHEWQELSVHLLHLRPVAAVLVRYVEVVALVAPALVEDLLELLARVEIHPQADVEASLARLRRVAVRVDEEEVDGGATRGSAAASAAATAATTGAIEQLAAVGADRGTRPHRSRTSRHADRSGGNAEGCCLRHPRLRGRHHHRRHRRPPDRTPFRAHPP